MAIPKDPKQYAAPKPAKGQGTSGKGTAKGGTVVASTGGGGMPSSYAGVGDYIDPLTVSTAPVDLTDMGQFVNQLKNISQQAANVGPIDFTSANQRARVAAGQDIRAQVAPLLTQQQQLLRTGRQQAGLINQAGQSAAAFTEPWAQAIRDSFMALGNQQLQYAQGLSGATREAALADANAYGNQMAAMGSPQTIDATRANALASALSGLGGLGAQTLGQQAVSAQIGAYGIPQQLLGYGMAQAAGTLGAATQKAAEINPQIANIRATRGKLTREYASDFRQEAIQIRNSRLEGLKLKADLVSTMGTLASASNTDKLKLREFEQNRITAHNQVVEAIKTGRREEMRIAEDIRHNRVSEAQGADQIAATREATAASIAQANQTLALQWAQAKGWYRDANGNPVAMPGNRLVIGKNGKISAVETLTPEQAAAAKLDARGAAATEANARGWYWEGTGKDRHRVAQAGNKLVYDKNGKFVGIRRDPTQYATGTTAAAGLKPKDRAKLLSTVKTDLQNWAFGKPPEQESGALPGTFQIPGYDKQNHTITNLELYRSAGGTLPLKYSEIYTQAALKYGQALTDEQIRALIDSYYLSQGENPAYARRYNLAVGEQKDIAGPPVPRGLQTQASGFQPGTFGFGG